MADERRLDGELASFRREWQEEIRRTVAEGGSSSRNSPVPPESDARQQSSEGSPEPLPLTKDTINTAQILEEKATKLFLEGVSAERNGKVYEATYFYRQALQLVPDIESKIKDFTNFNLEPEDEDDTYDDNLQTFQDAYDISNPDDSTIRFNALSVNGICRPQYETRMTHISDIPLELIMYIFKWVVSTELDMKSLDQLARVCKGFYVCARDPEIWKLACQRVWGLHCSSASQWNGSWRLMYIKQPHLLFVGVYISKTSYVRPGEKTLSFSYRPFHSVEYFRYMRFFVDGSVLLHTSADEPVTALARLKHKHGGGNPSVSVGHYRLSEDMVTIVLNRKPATDSHNQARGRKTRGPPSPILEQVFHMELKVSSTGRRRRHNRLTWAHYSVSTTYRSSGQTVCSEFDLNNQFPPLYFSVVKSFCNNAVAPLG